MNNKLMITFDKLEPEPSLRERTRRKIYHRPDKRHTKVTGKADGIQNILYLWKDGDDCFVAYGNTYKIVFTAEQQSFLLPLIKDTILLKGNYTR